MGLFLEKPIIQVLVYSAFTVNQYNFAIIKFCDCLIFGLLQEFSFREYVKIYMYIIGKFNFSSAFHLNEAHKVRELANFYTSPKYVAIQYTNH